LFYPRPANSDDMSADMQAFCDGSPTTGRRASPPHTEDTSVLQEPSPSAGSIACRCASRVQALNADLIRFKIDQGARRHGIGLPYTIATPPACPWSLSGEKGASLRIDDPGLA
jgi:hypothetical protein